jgi:hypothetical protein
VGDIDFKVISTDENSNKFQKTRFWKEKSVEDVERLGPMAHATLINIIKPPAFNPEFQHFTCIFNKSSLLCRYSVSRRSKEEFRNERRAQKGIIL